MISLYVKFDHSSTSLPRQSHDRTYPQTGLYFSLGSPLADYHERAGWRFFTYVNAVSI